MDDDIDLLCSMFPYTARSVIINLFLTNNNNLHTTINYLLEYDQEFPSIHTPNPIPTIIYTPSTTNNTTNTVDSVNGSQSDQLLPPGLTWKYFTRKDYTEFTQLVNQFADKRQHNVQQMRALVKQKGVASQGTAYYSDQNQVWRDKYYHHLYLQSMALICIQSRLPDEIDLHEIPPFHGWPLVEMYLEDSRRKTLKVITGKGKDVMMNRVLKGCRDKGWKATRDEGFVIIKR